MEEKIKVIKDRLIFTKEIEDKFEKLVSGIVRKIVNRIKTDKVQVLGSCHKSDGIPYNLIIDSKKYGYFSVWNMNDYKDVRFDCETGAGFYLKCVPTKLQKVFRDTLRTGYKAHSLGMRYEEFVKKQNDEKTKKELDKLSKIKEAKEILKKYGVQN